MSRFKTYGGREEPPLSDGDEGFVGVNQVDKPASVRPGEVAEARNARFTFGQAEPRRGLAKCAWTNQTFPATNLILPFTNIYGAGVFKDPDDVEWMIIAADEKVFRARAGAAAVALKLPTGVTIQSAVTFVQTFNGLVMFRGEDLEPLYLKDLDSGFALVTSEATSIVGENTENPTAGGNPIPNARNGEWIGNRLFVPHATASEKDLLGISDYLNATRFRSIMSQARINQGSSDRLVRFFKFSESAGVAFKEQSIHALYNIKGNLSSMVQDEVTSELGLVAPYTVVHAGRDADEHPSMLWFLAEKRGVCAILAGEYGKLQATAVPISRKIQKLIARIDWPNAGLARAAWWDNKFYLAIPLDNALAYASTTISSPTYSSPDIVVPVIEGQRYRWTPGPNEVRLVNGSETLTGPGLFTAATWKVDVTGLVGLAVTAQIELEIQQTNNAVLVYDFITSSWAGYDQSRGLCVKEFLKTIYNGVRRLFFLGSDGFINLVEDGFEDEVGTISLESVPVGSFDYDAGGRFELTVDPGWRMSYGLGANDLGIVNGSETLTGPAGSLVTRSNLITLLGTPGADITLNLYSAIWSIANEPVDFEVLTRGYTCAVGFRKQFRGLRAQVQTWCPKFSISVVPDGVGEDVDVEIDVTKSRTAYSKPFGAPDWDETNINDDHATPYREDYSIVLGDTLLPGIAAPFGRRYFVENLTGDAGVIYARHYVFPGETFVSQAAYTNYNVSLETDLKAFWLLEEASGNRSDAKGASHLVPTGTPGRAAAKVNYGVSLTLGTEDLQCPTNASLEMGDINFTLCGWFKFSTVAGAARMLFGKGYAGAAANEYCLAASSIPQNIRFHVHNGGSAGLVDSGLEPVTGKWYWVCAWHDAVANKIGIHVIAEDQSYDAVAAVTANHAAGVPVGANPFSIGNAAAAQPFLGQVDAVMVWKRVLTSDERAALFNAGAGLEPGLGGSPQVYQPGDYIFLGANGVDPDLHQESTKNDMLRPDLRGQFVQVRIRNTQGRCALLGVGVDANRADQRIGTHL